MLSYMLPIEGGDKGPASSNRSQEEEGNEEEEGRKAMGGVLLEEEEEDDMDVGEHRRLLDCTSDSRRAMKPPMVPIENKSNPTTTTMIHHSSKNEMSILINSPDKGVNSTDMDSLPTTHGEHKPKPKLILNGTKQPGSLKRVSFGSSKGSMVETLIFESPLQEEPETSPIQEVPPDGGTGSRPPYFPGSAVPHPHSLAYSHLHHNGGSDHGHHHGHYPGSDHTSSSPHGVGSPSSGAIGKVTSASSSLSSASTATAAEAAAAATSKVRVTFFESEKPHVVVGSPEPIANSFDATEDLLSLPLDAQGLASGSQQQQQLLLLATTTMTSPSPIAVPPYDRQTSTDSGWDNPFRPDGDLSREADEIVELIKGGKPITPTPGSTAPPLPTTCDSIDGPPSTPPGVHIAEKAQSAAQTNSVKPDGAVKPPSSPKGAGTGANGNAAPGAAVAASKGAPSSVEVQRAHVPPGDQCQVEHVVLKKKPKCKCCVIQ